MTITLIYASFGPDTVGSNQKPFTTITISSNQVTDYLKSDNLYKLQIVEKGKFHY